jgi:hypothetical protein
MGLSKIFGGYDAEKPIWEGRGDEAGFRDPQIIILSLARFLNEVQANHSRKIPAGLEMQG